jgi:N-acetylmuramoyl-L-alanine amidase
MEKLWIGCDPGNFFKGRRGKTPIAIVVHIMAGSLRGTDQWFNNPRSRVSAHYGIGKSGEIHQYVAETDTAYHAGTVDNPTWPLMQPGGSPGPKINPNYYTIGIEHEGFPDDVWPAAQVAASAALIAEVAARWKIERDVAHVIPHHSIRASKPCPGLKINIAAQLLGAPAPAPPAMPAGLVLLRDANVRRAVPSTTAPIAAVLKAGAAYPAVSITSGERVAGNTFWYHDADGNFLWAGATNFPNPA